MPVLELTDEQVIALVEQLPEEQKKRLLDRLAGEAAPPARGKRQRQFGSAKDAILFMADDFDAPLDDFREYM